MLNQSLTRKVSSSQNIVCQQLVLDLSSFPSACSGLDGPLEILTGSCQLSVQHSSPLVRYCCSILCSIICQMHTRNMLLLCLQAMISSGVCLEPAFHSSPAPCSMYIARSFDLSYWSLNSNNLGTGWASSTLGFLGIAFIPIPFVLWKYGERIRKMSKHARKDFWSQFLNEWLPQTHIREAIEVQLLYLIPWI